MTTFAEHKQAWKRRLFQLQSKSGTYGLNTPPEITIEIEDLTKKLRQADDIEHGLDLIETHRKSLRTLLKQRALHSPMSVPQGIEHGIRLARESIAHHKSSLLNMYGIGVEDQAEDVEQPEAPGTPFNPGTFQSPGDPLAVVRERLHTIQTLLNMNMVPAAQEQLAELRRLIG